MNTPAVRKLREKLKNDRTTHGVWVTLESASVTEMAVALGLERPHPLQRLDGFVRYPFPR